MSLDRGAVKFPPQDYSNAQNEECLDAKGSHKNKNTFSRGIFLNKDFPNPRLVVTHDKKCRIMFICGAFDDVNRKRV